MAGADFAMGLERLSNVFTPHRPIDLPEFLAGRVEVLYRAQDAVNTSGLHVILYGDRGIGKTSVARVLARLVQDPSRPDGRRALLVSCTTSDDFASIWRKVFQEVLLAERQMGFGQVGALQITGRLTFDEAITSPNDVRIIVESHPNPYVIMIDEFDRIASQSDARRLMADTIKLFSDTNVGSTVVLVGVGESIGELIGEHPSIARNIAQILLEPMSVEELSLIIKNGFERVGLAYQEELDSKIAELSQGYPAYTHLLGLWTGRRTLERGGEAASRSDLERAIADALMNATGGVQQAYENAIASPRTKHLFKEVLLACAVAPKDSLGRFKAVDLKGPLHEITNRRFETAAFQTHLAKFCEPERGPVLKRTGRKRNYRWQFVDPQIIPFIRLKGIEEGLLGRVTAQ